MATVEYDTVEANFLGNAGAVGKSIGELVHHVLGHFLNDLAVVAHGKLGIPKGDAVVGLIDDEGAGAICLRGELIGHTFGIRGDLIDNSPPIYSGQSFERGAAAERGV
jgi:hypothetical protein